MFQTLYEAVEAPPLPLPAAVEERYGRLGLPERVLYANFVCSLDGVVAFEPEVTRSAGRVLSGGSPADRFLMGLLRACADAIVVGAGTARDEADHVWTPARADPASADLFSDVRSALGREGDAPVFVVSASGRLDARSPGVRAATVITTEAGAALLPVGTRKVALGAGGPLEMAHVLAWVRAEGHGRILTEGGPRLMAALVAGGHVDELFLSLSPVVAGRDGPGRPGFLEGVRLLPQTRRGARLLSLRRSEDGLLFLRYALGD